jgi:uncharacterized protein
LSGFVLDFRTGAMAPTLEAQPMDEKDRLGSKLRDVERGREDQYFAKRDRELIEKLKTAQAGQAEEALRQAAHMRCPKCGEHLHSVTLYDVAVEECPACNGIWLDRGELERIAERENEGWAARWLRRLTHA